MSNNPLNEADFHAYVDGQLSETRHAEIETWLAGNPEEAARLHAYRAQRRALRDLFDPVLDEPLPAALRTLAVPPATAHRKAWLPRWSLQRIAAGVAFAMVGGLAGWLAHGQYHPTERLAQTTPLPRQAAIAHAVFSPDARRPVEIDAEHEEQLVTWLSKRLGTPVSPPKLGALGFELIGGRLLPGSNSPVAQFMYHDAAGQRLTLYISTENTANRDTAFRFAQEGSVNVFYWVDGKLGYALSASIGKNELAQVATAVYTQIEKN